MMFPSPSHAPTFDDPIAMLSACHERIAAQCVTLEKLRIHLEQHGCDAAAQQAATKILRYFNSAGQHHHSDEEDDLFPLLLATGDATAQQLVGYLLARHQELNIAWAGLRAALDKIVAGELSVLDVAISSAFIAAYQAHIALENAQLLPLAGVLLNATQRESLGRSMAARRGIKPPNDS
ncbi:MAG: hemerythrin domain-containing protein [Gallionella sp.]